jgi:hypothetical protein
VGEVYFALGSSNVNAILLRVVNAGLDPLGDQRALKLSHCADYLEH